MVRLRQHQQPPRGSSSSSMALPGGRGFGSALGNIHRRNNDNNNNKNVSWERGCIFLMLLLAWAWIMTTFGVVLYHGYLKKRQGSSSKLVSAYEPPPPAHVSIPGQLEAFESPLLIFTCHRPEYLRQTLDDILKYLPSKDHSPGIHCRMGCPIVISQDGNDAHVLQLVEEYQVKFQDAGIPVLHWQHKSNLRGAVAGNAAYQALAVHYGWALNKLFDDQGIPLGTQIVKPQRVIILEEDLHIAPDFFDYFAATAPLLDTDSTLLAISAFNDNGFHDHVSDPHRILRSDFFPGLGWMLTRKVWHNELQLKWPKGYWDDWLREPAQRQDRHVLRPEISRTYHFGVQGGASLNQFGGKLSSVLLNPTPIDWSKEDLSYLRLDVFDRAYWNSIHAARHAESLDQALEMSAASDVQVDYRNMPEFQDLARKLGIMDDEKAGIYRTAYKGVVEFRPKPDAGGHFLYLTPPIKDLQSVSPKSSRVESFPS